MSKHTQGPWIFVPDGVPDKRGGRTEMGGFKAEGGWVCNFGDCTTYYPTEGVPPNEADARLIAAAPDLLEALVDCRRVLELANFTQELAFVNFAIAKATGEQP